MSIDRSANKQPFTQKTINKNTARTNAAKTNASRKELAPLLHRQHGVVQRQQLQRLGYSNSQIDRRLRGGSFVRLAAGIYRHWSWPATWHGRLLALCFEHRALASRWSAATLLGIDGFRPGRPVLVVPHGHQKECDDADIHQSTQMNLAGVVHRDAIPCTGVERTVLDLAAELGPAKLNRTIDAVLRQRLTTWPDLFNTLTQHARRGRDGVGRLRAVLDHRGPDDPIPDSGWNRMVGDLLISAGMATPKYEHVIFDQAGQFVARADLAYPMYKVAIELDSLSFHFNLDSFHRDPQRKNKMLLAGWQVLTFTWRDYADNPSSLCQTVEETLRHAGRPAQLLRN